MLKKLLDGLDRIQEIGDNLAEESIIKQIIFELKNLRNIVKLSATEELLVKSCISQKNIESAAIRKILKRN